MSEHYDNEAWLHQSKVEKLEKIIIALVQMLCERGVSQEEVQEEINKTYNGG